MDKSTKTNGEQMLQEVNLSRVQLRSEDAATNRKTVVDGQPVEVHKIKYRHDAQLEVVTMDGKHIGFLAASGLKGVISVAKTEFGQAWDAKLRVSGKGKISVCFERDIVLRNTSFPERTMKYNWDREDFDLNQCPLKDAEFSVQVHAGIYGHACDEDVYRQYKEFKAQHPEKFAEQMILKESKAYEKQWMNDPDCEFPNPFYENDSSLALLETIPLGAEFEVKIDTVYLDVPNGSWAAMHSDDAEQYAYPVPAFVLFYQGVRVANIPLMMNRDDEKSSYSAFWAFWKWSKEPTLHARAWLVNFYNPDVIWDTEPACTFAIGFFPGSERIDGDLDLKQAGEYHRREQNHPLPVQQLMDLFARVERIDLSDATAHGDSNFYLKFADGTGCTLPFGMFAEDLDEKDSANKRNWMTIDQVFEGIDPPPPPKKSPYGLFADKEFSQFVYVTGTHVGNRPQTCLSLSNGDKLKIVREPKNPYDANAIAVCTTKGEQCGYVPAKMARWISPVLDAGIIKVKEARVEWVTDWGRKNFAQLEITIFFRIDSSQYNVVAWRGDPSGAPEIPFLVMGIDPKNPDGLFLIDVYNQDSEMWEAGLAYCDEAFGVNENESRPDAAEKTEKRAPVEKQSVPDTVKSEKKTPKPTVTAKEKARSKCGDDKYIVNMYVILTNEKKLDRLRRTQKEFYKIYQDDMILLAKADVAKLRKEILAEMEDEKCCAHYSERFMQRPLQERFDMSTRNLFNVGEETELDELAAWSIEHTKEWYQESEYDEVRRLMDETLAEVRADADGQLSAVDSAWTNFNTAKKSLRIYITDKDENGDDIDPDARSFQVFVGSAVVDVRLRNETTYTSCKIVDTVPWYWGVTTRDIWEEALKSEPRDLRDVSYDTDSVVNQAIEQIRIKYPALKASDPSSRNELRSSDWEGATQLQSEKKEGCYIATAVYGSYNAPDVMILRRFRDEKLQTTVLGRWFVRVYYRLSPPLAQRLKHARFINGLVRTALDRMVQRLSRQQR